MRYVRGWRSFRGHRNELISSEHKAGGGRAAAGRKRSFRVVGSRPTASAKLMAEASFVRDEKCVCWFVKRDVGYHTTCVVV